MIELDLQRTQGDFNLSVKCLIDAPVVGLFGASGAGKSTLLGMIAGLVTPNSGYLIIDGETLFDSNRGINVPLHQRHIGMVFQENRLFPHLNVRDNLYYGFNLLAQKDRRFGFSQIVDLLEIDPLLAQKPHQLSGGEKQRVALGRALLTSPRLLLLDEPLASLDVRLKEQILHFLRRVKTEIQIPMIYVSHAISEILYLTPQVAVLEQGKLLELGDFQAIIKQPNMRAVAQAMGLENVYQAVVVRHLIEEGYTTIKLGQQPVIIPLINTAIGEMLIITIAASHVALSLLPIEKVTIQNQLEGIVVAIKQIDYRVFVTVDIGNNQLVAEITIKGMQSLNIEIGTKLVCLVKAQAIHY